MKFKGRPEPMYFTPDERRVFGVRIMVCMGRTIGYVVQLPQGEAEMNFYISAGWRQGLFQLWVHVHAGRFIPKADNDVFEVEDWELYEYNLYASPTRGRQFPYLTPSINTKPWGIWSLKMTSASTAHCQIGKSVFTLEDGEPKFKLFQEHPTDNIVW